jgi:hypothetical protein
LALQRTAGNRAVTRALARAAPPARTLARMQPCPSRLADTDPVPGGWKPYYGNSSVFHCGYRGILEDRKPTPSDPMNECFYDHSGRLVDASHPDAACGGTPDYYDSETQKWGHFWDDPGGVRHAGWDAFWGSRAHDWRENVTRPINEWVGGLEREISRLYGVPYF